MKNGFVARKRWLSLVLAVSLLLGNVPLGAVATELPEEAAQMTEAPTEETAEAAEDTTEAPEETPETTEETQPAEETPEVTQPAQAVPAAEEHVHDYQPQEKTPTCTEPGYRGQVCTTCGDVLPDPVTTDITAAFRWTDGTMIQATTGARMTHSTWMASDYVDISGCTQLRILTADTVTADSTIGLAFYDANKAYISGVVHTDRVGDTYGILTHELTVPENAVYIRSTWYSQNHPGYEPSFGEFSCSVTGDCIPVTGHSYALTGHRDATCTAEGAEVYTCGSCGHSYEETLPRGEHRYDDGVCTACGISILGSDWIAPDFAQGDYTMVAIPDTQNLVTYWPEIYRHQMQWIADNRDTLNIQAVLHMGDMVNNNTDTEWRICEGGTDILEASGIPWMPMRGNHDDSAWFNKYYDHATYGTGKRWFGGSYHADKLDHTYWFVNAGGREYLILSLGWAPSWEVLTWAQGIVEANPKKNVILVDHGYMDKDGTLLSRGDAHCVSSYHAGYPDGEDVWAAFKGYENVVLAMAGHIHSPDVITYTDTNGAGRDVTSLLLDRQNDDTANRYAMVALLTFHEGSNTVDINWYSTRYDALYKGSNQFSIDVPHVEREEQPEDTSFRLALTSMNYFTVSRDETEKLACAPGLVSLGNGEFAVSYLADDTNTVETEASTTIVCRLGFFNLNDPEQGTFFDVARAGQTIGGVTIGSKAPYEPNLLKLSEKELLVLFNIRDTSGNYIYYSARFDTGSNTVTAYQPLTLDGALWTPANIAASYNALAQTDIPASGPAGSMVFTSQMIQRGGYYYGYCGGICAGFSGILVRSTDGINWSSVMVPEALSEMAGVIECGFQFLGDYVYFCMRDISSGVYHCSYDFTTGQQLTETLKLSGLTTSKPAAFIQDGKLYLIVNKATGDDSTVGRRNTALFYRVDPATCGLSLARQVFCADGVAYHSVVNVNGTNYWCFHTDARRINPYTQGHSNLAFRKIPALYATESGSVDGVLNLQNYSHMYAQGCITGSANAWQAGAVNMHYQIPLADFAGFDAVTVTANGQNKAYLAFFTDWMSKEGTIAYAEGWTEQLILEPGTSRTLPVPKDAQYLYILATNASGGNLLPESVLFGRMADAAKPLALQYDDHYDITGKTVEEVEDGNGVVTIEGNYLVATGIGSARVRIDGTLYQVTVEKAKVNLVVIMGQSNAGNHFANATSDVTCPIGTAYWWGNGKGTAAMEPVDYTQPSMGFHTPLLAELYAQSVAAGEPAKNVLIWQEGITSKNGKSITAWAPGVSDTSGTDGTVTMIENCIAYYTRHSDKYEILGKGVYWLQGESDTAMDPNAYTQRFMAVWDRLKQAGMEYVAFLRVRWGVNENGADHQDLHHSASLSAQLRMINENPEFYLATDLTENWVGTADTMYTVDISNYITMVEAYGGSPEYTDSYGNKASFFGGKLTTTMKELYGSNNSCHYGKFGYGLIGADAAYNMYRALKETNVALVMTDTSGHADRKQVLANGSEVTLDITDRTDDLSFRVECGSAAGTLKITAMRGREDITGEVMEASGAHFGALSTAMLMQYEADSLLLEYTTATGAVHKAVCRLTYQPPEPPVDYIWDFSEDLNARDAEGNVCNSFLTEALAGSYTLENGVLVGQGLQLELEQNIHLAGNKNWSVEWKYGAFTNGAGCFLLCGEKGNVIGNRAIFHASTGQLMISDYADSQGYRNYTDAKVSVSENDCLRIVNRYDPETGKSTLSLWQNGRRVIDDFQLKGSINKADDGTDMTVYPLNGSFDFGYLGNTGVAAWLLNCQLDYLKISFDEGPVETLSLDYDDRCDITGKTVQILEAGTPTSYQVGYGLEENAVPDTAVVELRGDSLVATGIGCARVRIDGILYEITVTAAPINLLLLIGQSNMEGNEGEAKQSISCPDGMVYATYGDRYDMVLENATHYAPSALTGQYRTVNTVGGTDGLCDYPVYMLTREGDGRKGPDSGFAYEWVKQTGEKVWIVNASHGGTSLNVWQPGTTQYEECQAMFGACAETLRKEIAAGHFTLNHMAYFWCQGCNDYDKTAKWYVENYLSMHESLKRELAFDHDSNAATPDRTFEFGGIIPVRVGHSWCTGYRDGIYTQTNPYRYYESYEDLRLSGPRVAQYWMTNNPDLPELWNVCTIGEDWVWMPDGTNGVTDYFRAHYPGGTVDYEPQVKQAEGWYTPTTPNAVHDSIHYNQIGYNEVGREAVRNALILMGLKPDYEEETTVTLVNWTGFESAETVPASTQGRSATLVVPIIKPVTRTKTVQFALSEGLRWEYYDLLADSVQQEGQLTTDTGETVKVLQQAPGEYLADHLRQLPETVCRGVNLWNTLERDSQYFTANGWGKHTSGQVYSLTIPVKAGDRIYATSFGPAGENGNNADGIRCTFFGEYEVIRTMAPAEVYSEFAANGYLTAPEGAIAVNVPMWNTEDTNELYLLSIPHDEREAICSICGKSSHVHSFGDWETVTLPSEAGPGIESRSCACGSRESREVSGVWQTLELGKYLTRLPESYCGGTELWQQLPHTQTYFHSGTHWDTNTAADVWAVTVPASSGDRIWATSFGAAGENGHTSAGIRVTFFDAYGIAKTLTPTETYAEFKANGYLTAPEGTVAVNVPMYGDTGNELYLLSAPHSWQEEGASIRVCSLCGQAEDGYRIEAPGDEVWIDGVKYAAREDKDGKFVQMERTDAQTLVVYSYKEAASSDPHTQYPTGMQVWRLTFENGSYVSTHMPELDNLLQYAGSSIRVTGVKGIRMITGIDKALRSALMEGKLGYTLIEYGTAVSWAKDLNGTAPVLGKGYTMHNYAYKRDTADPIFADTGDTIQYTNVLVGFTDDQLGKDLILRPYIILEDAAGERLTIYGGCVQRSIAYIAKQNRDTFPEGSKADTYIEDIISKVYG